MTVRREHHLLHPQITDNRLPRHSHPQGHHDVRYVESREVKGP